MRATAIGLMIFYCLSCLCLGSLVMRFIAKGSAHLKRNTALTTLTTSFLLGQGLLANVWLLLALPGWFSPRIVAVVNVACVLAGILFTWPHIRKFAFQLRQKIFQFRKEPIPWKLLGALILIIFMTQGLAALLLPPRGDAVAFYMALPKVIAASHRLRPLPGYEAFTQIGLQGELHFAALMSLGSAQFAKLVVWPTSLALAIMLISIGTKVGLRARGKWLVIALLFSSTAFTFLISDGKVDLFGAAMGMAAFFWASQTGVSHEKTALCLSGLFTGFAVVAKISYLPVLVPGIIFLVVWRCAQSNRSIQLRTCLHHEVITVITFGLWMILPVVSHVIKNSILFREPFAPFMLFRGQSWININRAWFTPEITKRIILTYPLALVFGQYPMQYGNLSPLILAFTPLCFLLRRRSFTSKTLLLQVTLSAVLGIIIWLIYRPSVLAPRYILTPLLIFILLAALGAEHVFQSVTKGIWLRVSIIVCVYLSLLFTLQMGPLHKIHNILSFITSKQLECVNAGSNCRASIIINQEAAPGDRVYLLGYYRYWLRPDLLQCINGANDYQISEFNTPEERFTYLYERGFRYLMIDKAHPDGNNFLTDLSNVPNWLTLVQLYNDKAYIVYRLESNDSTHQIKVTCCQKNPPAWDVIER